MHGTTIHGWARTSDLSRVNRGRALALKCWICRYFVADLTSEGSPERVRICRDFSPCWATETLRGPSGARHHGEHRMPSRPRQVTPALGTRCGVGDEVGLAPMRVRRAERCSCTPEAVTSAAWLLWMRCGSAASAFGVAPLRPFAVAPRPHWGQIRRPRPVAPLPAEQACAAFAVVALTRSYQNVGHGRAGFRSSWRAEPYGFAVRDSL